MTKARKFVKEKGYYEILEISPSATTIEIQRSFERLCEEHVNINAPEIETRKKSAEILFTLTKGYEILTDPFQRLSYDERRFGSKLPFNNEVETIFKEGLRAFRNSEIDTAVRFFKEAVYLLPHKVLYRVNLAIAYNEKGWTEYAEKELRMALRLDPENEFAQEVVARLLFKVSDKKRVGLFVHKVNRQIAAIAAISIVTCGLLITGVPRAMAAFDRAYANETIAYQQEQAESFKSSLPTDMKQAMKNTGNKQASVNVKIEKLADEFVPAGQVYDYSNQTAVKKTFYADQNLIVVDYDNGSMLTYKPQDLQGWKYDVKTKTPVVLTKGNEIIPVPTNIPVTLSSGETVNPGDANFPSAIFPEYKAEQNTAAKTVENKNETTPAQVNTAPIGSSEAAPAGLPPVAPQTGA